MSWTTGCAEDFPAGTAEQRGVGEVALESGVTFELVPGAARLDDDATLVARTASPEPTMSVSTLANDSPTLTIEIENVPRTAEIEITNFLERDSAASPDCPESTDGVTRCDESSDPRCDMPPVTQPGDDPNIRRFEWTQDRCLRTSFRIAIPDEERQKPMRVGLVGSTASPDNTREALDALVDETPDFVVLLGDNAIGSEVARLNSLANLLTDYDFPSYVLPGENETTPTSRASFRAVFGPYDFNYDFKGTRFVLMYSAGGILGSRRIFQLRSALVRFADIQPVVVLTHTPPIDPIGARNDGFLSELEGARTLSILAEFGADLLIAGHVNDAHDVDARGVDMRVTSAEEYGEQVLLLTAPSSPESGDALEIEAISLD
jgi:hypothetical protein